MAQSTGIAEIFRKEASTWLKSKLMYADRKIVVLNKPPGLVSQASGAVKGRLNLLRARYTMDHVYSDLEQCFSSKGHPYSVHRLDKGTTGCLALALNPQTARSLAKQFKDSTVRKTYLALVRGGTKSFPSLSGRFSDPIRYDDGRGEVHSEGKTAITNWEVLASSDTVPLSLLKLNLVTGNKHQIRIHLAEHNIPILGDTLYSHSRVSPQITEATKIPEDRVFLHAFELSFTRYQAGTGKPYQFGIRAPLPLDFKKILRETDLGKQFEVPGRALLINQDEVNMDQLHEYEPDFYCKFAPTIQVD